MCSASQFPNLQVLRFATLPAAPASFTSAAAPKQFAIPCEHRIFGQLFRFSLLKVSNSDTMSR